MPARSLGRIADSSPPVNRVATSGAARRRRQCQHPTTSTASGLLLAGHHLVVIRALGETISHSAGGRPTERGGTNGAASGKEPGKGVREPTNLRSITSTTCRRRCRLAAKRSPGPAAGR